MTGQKVLYSNDTAFGRRHHEEPACSGDRDVENAEFFAFLGGLGTAGTPSCDQVVVGQEYAHSISFIAFCLVHCRETGGRVRLCLLPDGLNFAPQQALPSGGRSI